MNPDLYLASSVESFFYMRKGHPAIKRQGKPNYFNFRPVASDSKIHPTEKPIELMSAIYEIFVDPGSRIVIPFLGSGNGVLAAHNVGCTAFGWDLSQRCKDGYTVRVDSGDGKVYSSYR